LKEWLVALFWLVGYIAVSHPPDTFTIPFAFVFLRFNPEKSYNPDYCIYNNSSYINNATGKGSGNIPTPGFSTPDRSLYQTGTLDLGENFIT
jgi:hypothetical protein